MVEYEVYANIAKETRDEHADLMSKENVVGVAVGHKVKDDIETDEPCVTVFVSRRVKESDLASKDLVEREIRGYKTDVVEIGEIFAGGTETEELYEEPEVMTLKQRIRPVMGGFSVGYPRVTAGTIATCVYKGPVPGIPSKYYILSNNHVLANCNNARVGDPILQPGRYDGGTYPRDMVARLSQWVNINWISGSHTPHNLVDAAIAEGELHNLNREIYWIGYVKGENYKPKINQVVQKTGRTTNYTTGKILALHATVDVNYPYGKKARFVDQIITSRMGAGGDSGSLICGLAEGAIGLLFAGSNIITIANRIQHVQRLLNIELHP